VKAPGGSETFFTPATSPVEGGLPSVAAANVIPSTTVHAEPLQQSGTSPARLLRSNGLDANRPASTDHATTLPGSTVSKNGQLVATQQDTNVQGFDRLTLSTDYSFKTPPTASSYLSGFHTSHEEHNRQPNAPQAARSAVRPDPVVVDMLATRASSDPELMAVMAEVAAGRATPEQADVFQKHMDEVGAVAMSQKAREAAEEEERRQAMHNAAVHQGRTTMTSSETLTNDQAQAQATPATSHLEPSTTPLRALKPDWKELANKQPQATTTTSPVVAPESSLAKEKIFTPHPDVSSMSGYAIVAPVKNKDNTKNMGGSALKAATPVKSKDVSKDKAEPVLKPATPIATMAAPTVPIIAAPKSSAPVVVKVAQTTPIVAAPQPGSLPETPKEAIAPAQKPDSPHESVEPPPKRQKVTRGDAQPAPLPETPKEALVPAKQSVTPQGSVEPAPKLQKGTRGVAQPVKKTPASATKKKTALAKNTPTPAVPTTTDSPSAAAKHAQRIASVIAGTILPKSKAEARAAATEHHALLLAAHNAQPEPNRRTSTRLVQKNTNPDLMPFFFSRPPPDATNTNKQGEQQDFIRCICGVQHDDGDNMICCDTCDIWQHSACVLPGLAEAQVKKLSKWECTVCDPWGHREVLRGLRASASAAPAT
jgi:hypothetical protein